VERFLQLFARLVDFTYTIWDRIVLRGYYAALQRPENIVYFFREVCGVRCITPAVLAQRTERYRRWVEGEPTRHPDPERTARSEEGRIRSFSLQGFPWARGGRGDPEEHGAGAHLRLLSAAV
jgi:hypothetical protein